MITPAAALARAFALDEAHAEEQEMDTNNGSTNYATKWKIERCKDLTGDYFTVSRTVRRRRVHLKYASDGQPMLYGREQAEKAVASAEREYEADHPSVRG